MSQPTKKAPPLPAVRQRLTLTQCERIVHLYGAEYLKAQREGIDVLRPKEFAKHVFDRWKNAGLTGTNTEFPGAWYVSRTVRKAYARLKVKR